jgi:hypothetical protein
MNMLKLSHELVHSRSAYEHGAWKAILEYGLLMRSCYRKKIEGRDCLIYALKFAAFQLRVSQ